MNDDREHLRQSALVMRIMGWMLSVFIFAALLLYPPGFLWGQHPPIPLFCGPPHPPSPYDALHPYLFMIGAMYVALGILFIRGARDPKANAALFDYGILANLLHGLVMIPQAFIYPGEHAHLWADIPLLFVTCGILWRWHPNRARTAKA